MPQSLMLNTPPPLAPFKRQRSRGGEEQSRPGSASGQARSAAGFDANGAYEPRPTVRMPSYLNKNKSEITTMFHELEWKQRFRLSHALNNPHDSPFRVDRSMIVVNRNRYGNVQPWDASRIKLKTPIGGSDYVNASPISLKSRSTPPSSQSDLSSSNNTLPEQTGSPSVTLSENKYIATQGPKDGQFSHFWSMVMQETVGPVGVIVMLTQCYEGNKEKCSQYFPGNMDDPTIVLPVHENGDEEEGEEEEEEELTLSTGSRAGTPVAAIVDDGDPFTDPKPLSADTDCLPALEPSESSNTTAAETPDQDSSSPDSPPSPQSTSSDQATGTITLLSIFHDPSIACEVRIMKLSIGTETKEIYHYLFNGWPDYGKPEAEDRRALIELLRISRERAGGIESGNPRFVHCSAGVGRTGTFIALDFLVAEILAGRVGIPVESAVVQNQAAAQSNAKVTETWGRSGPTKEKQSTPDPATREKGGDLIYETVNTLREQRMMMVMNELQYSFIYEVVREVFVDVYKDKSTRTGASVWVRGGDGSLQEPVPKIPRIEGEEGGSTSDAETEIMEGADEEECEGVRVDKDGNGEGLTPRATREAQPVPETEKDPYDAVAPQSIRPGRGQYEEL